MSTETATQEELARASGPAALSNDEDQPVQRIRGESHSGPKLGSNRLREGMPPEERRKVTAQWLSTWLKEGDTRLAVN